MQRNFSVVVLTFLLTGIAAWPAAAQEITAKPSSINFGNVYVGKSTAGTVITITNVSTGTVIIESIAFSCAGYGISSGVAPTSLYKPGDITHYSIYFQPTAAQSYDCNFELTLQDNSVVDVPLTGTGLVSTATVSVSPTSLSFANQKIGSSSAAQTFTITNTGTSSVNLNTITISPPDVTTNTIKLPYTIAKGAKLTVSVYYSPSQVTSETGAIDLTYNNIPDNGVSIAGNGVAATSLAIANFATLPQATASAAYLATLNTSSGVAPFTWSLASGSTLPSGLSLSTAGVISGTLASSVKTGTYTFKVQVTDSTKKSATKTFSLGVYANLGDNCADITYDVPGTTTPIVALTDLGTGTFLGSEGGLYPNGSNIRPASQDSYGVTLAEGIQPSIPAATRSHRKIRFDGHRRIHRAKRIQPLPAHRQRRSRKESQTRHRQRRARRSHAQQLHQHHFIYWVDGAR